MYTKPEDVKKEIWKAYICFGFVFSLMFWAFISCVTVPFTIKYILPLFN